VGGVGQKLRLGASLGPRRARRTVGEGQW
jgi:hypothetical protein